MLLTSSASYVIAGLFVLWWASRHNSLKAPISRWQVWTYVIGLVAAGLGSMDYHGPALGPEPLLHDAGLAVALVAAVGIDLTQLKVWQPARSWGLLALTIAAIGLIAVFPAVSPALAGVAAIGLVITEILVYRRGIRVVSKPLLAGLTALVLGAAIFALSRTGGPLCDPQSPFQGHAVWHVLTALALGLWLVTALPDNVHQGRETA